MKIVAVDDATSDWVVHQLGHVAVFQALTILERTAVLSEAELVTVNVGEIIVKEGETTQEFYVLIRGEATLMVTLPGDYGDQDVGRLSAGAIIGELAALLNEPRTATLVAAEPCQLLRFQVDKFHALFAKVPSFGLALSRSIAQRLHDVFLDKVDLMAESMPKTVMVPQSDLSRMRSYMAKYYATALTNIVRKHQLVLQRNFPRYQTEFSVSAEEQARWFELFNVSERERQTPFTYFTTSGTMILMQLVGDVGVNFKNLLHLKSTMRFNAAGRVPRTGEQYVVATVLDDIIQLRTDRVVLVVRTSVYAADKFLMHVNEDYFIILNLDPEYLKILHTFKRLGHHDPHELDRVAERRPQLTSHGCVQSIDISVPHDMGIEYGKVSGDLNMVHTTAFAAKLFGYRKPFIQGLCTANYVLKHLTGSTNDAIGLFDITFARPVFVGEIIHLYFVEDSFEVCRADGKLAAYGSWMASPS